MKMAILKKSLIAMLVVILAAFMVVGVAGCSKV